MLHLTASVKSGARELVIFFSLRYVFSGVTGILPAALHPRRTSVVIFRNGVTFHAKVASGAWGFGARGYPSMLFHPRALFSLLSIPPRQWPGMILVWIKLVVEWYCLRAGMLNSTDFIFTTKTLSFDPITGNPYGAWLRVLMDGYLNAVGLANPGLVAWVRAELPSLVRRGVRPIVSIAPNTPEEAETMVGELAAHDLQISAIELNPGCPNTDEGRRMFQDPQAVVDIVRAAVRMAGRSNIPVILKLSVMHDWKTIIRQCASLVDAFELINSVPWKQIYGTQVSPLEAYGGGGCSGPVIYPIMREVLIEARKMTTKPLLAGGGITTLSHAREIMRLGADAVVFGTAFISDPRRTRDIARELKLGSPPRPTFNSVA